ncbi:DUF3885 domain-containing protein [Flavobacterium subsaxonicum]|uniref:DUF3885 domain-containing protein n=1 Tax=Flavobacterium subsaxonicum TaxID=426226 RepID=UPI000414E1BD|nr:DUF3885 domain-containing protein [Flavobacterium subsaxonicum]
MNIKQEYFKFLDDNFDGLTIKPPLFYRWQNGLRFNLQSKTADSDSYFEESDSYFEEVVKRASLLFESFFDADDSVYMVVIEHKFKRQKIRRFNYIFNQIQNLKRQDIDYYRIKNFFDEESLNYPFDQHNVAIVQTIAKNIGYQNILKAISYRDFPRIIETLGSKSIYFINVDKKLIFSMYDDRGLDVIASNKETLRANYIKHNSLILDYNRQKIDSLFNQPKN